MIVALFALGAAMVIGGVAAVIQGFPFVRLESGLAMVIAGATVASAGTVVFGLGVVAAGLRRVAKAFDARPIVDAVGSAQDGGRTLSTRVLPQTSSAPAHPAPDLPPHEPTPSAPPLNIRPTLPSAALPKTAALAGLAAGALGGQRRTEPAFEATPAEAAPAVQAEPPEPELPLPELTPLEPVVLHEPEPASPAPEPVVAPEDDLFAAPDAGPAAVEAPELRPSLDAGSEPEAAPDTPAPAPSLDVVGRYASGGNTYVMFSDGSIEAETPQGRFTFASLDELKAFVEGGGEAASRGAA